MLELEELETIRKHCPKHLLVDPSDHYPSWQLN